MEQQIEQEELYLLDEPTKRPFSDGLSWLKTALQFFREYALKWLLISFIMLLCLMGSGFILGLLGSAIKSEIITFIIQMLGNIFSVMLAGGLVLCMASQVENDDLEIQYLFAAIKEKWQDLLILCVIFSVLGGLIGLFGALFFMGSIANGGSITLIILLALLFYIILCMLGFFALPLIVLHDIKPITAIKMSFVGCLKNIAPLICLSVCLLLLGIGFGVLFMLLFSLVGGATSSSPIGLNGASLFLVLIFGFVIMLLAPIVNTGIIYSAYRNVWTNMPLE